MVAEAQTCAIGIITILNILVALYLSRVLYKSTLFMQNKPNLLNAEMNVSSVNTMNYELRTMNYFMQNKPNQTQFEPKTNPISFKAEMNVNFYSARNYENETAFVLEQNKPNQSQFQTQSNPISKAEPTELNTENANLKTQNQKLNGSIIQLPAGKGRS